MGHQKTVRFRHANQFFQVCVCVCVKLDLQTTTVSRTCKAVLLSDWAALRISFTRVLYKVSVYPSPRTLSPTTVASQPAHQSLGCPQVFHPGSYPNRPEQSPSSLGVVSQQKHPHKGCYSPFPPSHLLLSRYRTCPSPRIALPARGPQQPPPPQFSSPILVSTGVPSDPYTFLGMTPNELDSGNTFKQFLEQFPRKVPYSKICEILCDVKYY